MYTKLKSLLEAIFSLPPDVIQQEEVAVIGAGAVLLNLHIGDVQKAALLTLLGVAYLAARGIFRATNK